MCTGPLARLATAATAVLPSTGARFAGAGRPALPAPAMPRESFPKSPAHDPDRAPAAAPLPAARRFRFRTFRMGVLVGIALVLAVQQVVQKTLLVDVLLAPLALADTPGRGDVIVVPGAGVNLDCSPNLFAIRRTMLAKRLYVEGRAPRILFSGGAPSDTPCAVATVMADLARQLGVPADRIVTETAARSTWDNARFSDPLLRAMGARRIVLVTDFLHMRRASATFSALGYEVERASVPSPAAHQDNMSVLYFGTRELAAWAWYWGRGRFVVHAAERPQSAAASPSPTTAPMPSPASASGPIVILGASYAQQWPLAVPGWRIVNKGIAGQVSAEVRDRFQRDVVPERPRAVIIWGFINDVFRATPDRMPATLAAVRENVQAMVAAARTAGIEPILATEVTVRGGVTWGDWAREWIGWALGKESYQAMINRQVHETNAWLRDYAARERLLLLDLQPVVSNAKGFRVPEHAQPDGSHISPAGYQALTRYAGPTLAAHLGRP